jgi:hypothetical protein
MSERLISTYRGVLSCLDPRCTVRARARRDSRAAPPESSNRASADVVDAYLQFDLVKVVGAVPARQVS